MRRALVAMSVCVGAFMLWANDTQVDAITAATVNNDCKIVSITPGSTSAVITWSESHPEKPATSIVYYDTVNPPAFHRTITDAERAETTVTITSLASSKKYYFVIDIKESPINWYQATGNFTTLAATALGQNQKRSWFDSHSLLSRALPGDAYVISDLQGAVVAEDFFASDRMSLKVPDRGPGLYMISLVRHGSIIGTCRALVRQ
jgi:hypothetical protein